MERKPALTPLSQRLRKDATKEENLLWYNFLRQYPLQFRRQYVIGSYIVDFYCHQAKLAIELDGSQHYDPQGQLRDQKRTQFLTSQGIKVIRFSNSDIRPQFAAVCESIDLEIKSRINSPEVIP